MMMLLIIIVIVASTASCMPALPDFSTLPQLSNIQSCFVALSLSSLSSLLREPQCPFPRDRLLQKNFSISLYSRLTTGFFWNDMLLFSFSMEEAKESGKEGQSSQGCSVVPTHGHHHVPFLCRPVCLSVSVLNSSRSAWPHPSSQAGRQAGRRTDIQPVLCLQPHLSFPCVSSLAYLSLFFSSSHCGIGLF